MIEFDEEVFALGDADGFALVVVFGSKEYTDDRVGNVLFAVDCDLDLVRFVVQPLEVSKDVLLNLFLLLLLALASLSGDCVEVDVVIAEEGDKLANVDVLDGNTGQDEVIVLISWQRFLVSLVEVHNFLVELVEDWVVNSGLSKFKGRWIVVPDVLSFGCIAKKFAGYGLDASVIPVSE